METVLKVLNIITEVIVPIALYILFAVYLNYSTVKNIKAVWKIKREGVTVPAKVTSYRARTFKSGRVTIKMYIVTVKCKSLDLDEEQEFILSTTSHRGKRYARVKDIKVIFPTKNDNSPILTEELRILKKDGFLALFGGLICDGVLLLILVAFLLKQITGKTLADYFPGLF